MLIYYLDIIFTEAIFYYIVKIYFDSVVFKTVHCAYGFRQVQRKFLKVIAKRSETPFRKMSFRYALCYGSGNLYQSMHVFSEYYQIKNHRDVCHNVFKIIPNNDCVQEFFKVLFVQRCSFIQSKLTEFVNFDQNLRTIIN